MLSLPAFLKLIATAPDGEARARFLHDGARSLLADPRMVVTVAVGAASADDASQTEAAAALLSRALDEARMSVENGTPEGAALIEAAALALAARDAAAPFPPTVRLRLAQIYARAGLAPPPFAMLTPETIGNLRERTHIPASQMRTATSLRAARKLSGERS